MKLIRSKFVWASLGGVFLVEAMSALSYVFPTAEPYYYLLLMIGMLAVSLWQLRLGVAVVLAELIIGSKGHLLDLDFFGPELSLRMGLFIVLLIATGYHILKDREISFFKAKTEHLFLLLFGSLLIGLALAFIYGNPLSLIYADGNSYIFFLLILPFYQGIKHITDIKIALSVMTGAIIGSLLKTAGMLLVFSHDIPMLSEIYRWVRVTGVGEITALDNSYRIFFQSHIYAIFFLAFILTFLFIHWRTNFSIKSYKPYIILATGCVATILISGSRSIWLASIIMLGFFSISFLTVLKTSWPVWKKGIGFGSFFFIGGFLWIIGITNIPVPGLETLDFSTSNLVTERTGGTGSDAASSSRLALLAPLVQASIERPVFGSGFGSTVTYVTDDLRFIDMNGHGNYTTYAFEWGYLDILYKTGIVGLAGWFILGAGLLTYIFLIIRHEHKPSQQVLLLTAGLGLITVFGIHATTPYLNHPLGIGWLLFSATIVESSLRKHT